MTQQSSCHARAGTQVLFSNHGCEHYRAIRHVRPPRVNPVRMHLYQRAIRIAVLGNRALAFAKGAAAWLSDSTARLATDVDSATDLVYARFMARGLWFSRQPADESLPQAHARVEPIASAMIALMMALAGLEVVRQAIDHLMADPAAFGWGGPAAVLIGSQQYGKMRLYSR